MTAMLISHHPKWSEGEPSHPSSRERSLPSPLFVTEHDNPNPAVSLPWWVRGHTVRGEHGTNSRNHPTRSRRTELRCRIGSFHPLKDATFDYWSYHSEETPSCAKEPPPAYHARNDDANPNRLCVDTPPPNTPRQTPKAVERECAASTIVVASSRNAISKALSFDLTMKTKHWIAW